MIHCRERAEFHAVLLSRRQIPTAVSAFVEFAVELLQAMMATQARKPALSRQRRRASK